MKRLLIAALLGILIGCASGLGYFYHSEKQGFKTGYWDYPPAIIDCTYSNLAEDRLTESVLFWQKIGVEFAFIESDPPDSVCSADYLYGFIIIKNDTLHWPTIGSTGRSTTINGKINSALIRLNPGNANDPRLLEHEIGHALGYQHRNDLGHIMHEIYDYTGYNFY